MTTLSLNQFHIADNDYPINLGEWAECCHKYAIYVEYYIAICFIRPIESRTGEVHCINDSLTFKGINESLAFECNNRIERLDCWNKNLKQSNDVYQGYLLEIEITSYTLRFMGIRMLGTEGIQDVNVRLLQDVQISTFYVKV